MFAIDPSWIIVFTGLFAILLELVVGIETGFDLLLIGLAFIVGGIVGLFIGNWTAGIAVVGFLAFFYIFLGRQHVKKRLSIKTNKTNVDVLIGKTAVVTKKITPHNPGQIKAGNEVWRAKGKEPFKQGERVRVDDIDGVTVRVIKYKP